MHISTGLTNDVQFISSSPYSDQSDPKVAAEWPTGALHLCTFVPLRDRRIRKLWIVGAYAPTETAEDNGKDAFYDELNVLLSKIPSQQVIIVELDANAKTRLEQQSDMLGKWY
ncbi:hypothetical protein RB195_015574 [Necator americanus]|uniref:Uncharacterized protein n=1 Tax=Necator americanus TaxID=51031 RepID=A0ABR1E570_NECAM